MSERVNMNLVIVIKKLLIWPLQL